MSTEPKLKPCPFCLSEDVEIMNGYEHAMQAHYVRCQKCAADGPWRDDEHGTKWNAAIRKDAVREQLRLVKEVHFDRFIHQATKQANCIKQLNNETL